MPKPAKSKVTYVCDACGNETPRWEGRCPACGQWNTLGEVRQSAAGRRNGRSWSGVVSATARELSEVTTEDLPRILLSSGEVNRVLGGGVVPGSLVLIAGDPGIGKSTLLLRLAADVCAAKGETLYVSGEESSAQIRMRADRLGIPGRGLYVLPASNIADVLDHLESRNPVLAVVDSIQTVYDEAITSEPGSVVQIRECARRLMEWAKNRNTAVILTGHVTKGGDIAGPRVLEHMVDVVLYLEGDPISSWRLLRTVKNRFGSTNEVGVFEMTGSGLAEVEDPSMALLSERSADAVGSVVVATIEGSRPMLVEIQALTSPSYLPTPRRVATGIEYNRLLLACAVLSRRAGVALGNQDVVVNVAGGLRVSEPAADLGLALAIASSMRNSPVDSRVAAIGEVGLSGEVRRVTQLERRVRELARMGFTRCLVPACSGQERREVDGMRLTPVHSLSEAIRVCIAPPE